MNIAKISTVDTTFTNDNVFHKVMDITANDAAKLSSTFKMYLSGDIKTSDGTVIDNPLTSTAQEGFVDIEPLADKGYGFSKDKKWVIYRNGGIYTLYYNTFYSPDFIREANINTDIARSYFIKYCDMVNYADSNCLCVQGTSDGGRNCLRKIGLNPDTMSEYAINEMGINCMCLNQDCVDIRQNGSKIFQKNCDGIVICNTNITATDGSTVGAVDIAQKCGITNVKKEEPDTTVTPETPVVAPVAPVVVPVEEELIHGIFTSNTQFGISIAIVVVIILGLFGAFVSIWSIVIALVIALILAGIILSDVISPWFKK